MRELVLLYLWGVEVSELVLLYLRVRGDRTVFYCINGLEVMDHGTVFSCIYGLEVMELCFTVSTG